MSDFSLNHFLSRFLLRLPCATTSVKSKQQAAVLIPVVHHCQHPGIILTRRADSLRNHAGQIAFPGGMQESSDTSLIATALREADEEIGLDPGDVRVLGTLPAVTSRTGFQVTPVVGLIPPHYDFHLSTHEVAMLFEMPLAEALRLNRYIPLDIPYHNTPHRIWMSWYQQHMIWGMTAGIIRQLGQQIAES
ncbi:CoA pyrophosphatase [Enterobacteriaceae bacterium LUAb1]